MDARPQPDRPAGRPWTPARVTPTWNPPPSGYGNYNALFVTHHIRDFHGINATSNFTWGRALGLGTTSQATSSNTALDNYNLQNNYGPQSFDVKFIYNIAMYYSPKVYQGQKGILGHVLGGWTFSPLFTAQSGNPLHPTFSEGGCSGCQAFGEVSTTSSATTAFIENAQGAGPYTGGSKANYNVAGSGGVGTTNPTGVNMFADPAAVLARNSASAFSASTATATAIALRTVPRWNLDLGVHKIDHGLEGNRGRRTSTSVHQRAEPRRDGQPDADHHHAFHVRPHHRHRQHSAQHGVRLTAPLLTTL